jgi:hypothetical protein
LSTTLNSINNWLLIIALQIMISRYVYTSLRIIEQCNQTSIWTFVGSGLIPALFPTCTMFRYKEWGATSSTMLLQLWTEWYNHDFQRIQCDYHRSLSASLFLTKKNSKSMRDEILIDKTQAVVDSLSIRVCPYLRRFSPS